MKSLKEPTCIHNVDAILLNALMNYSIIKSKDDKAAIALIEAYFGVASIFNSATHIGNPVTSGKSQ